MNKSATLVVQTEVINDYDDQRNVQVRIILKDNSGKIIAQSLSKNEIVSKEGY